MATVVNARDVLLQGASSRLLTIGVGSNVQVPIQNVPGLGTAITGLSLTGSSPVFQISKIGTASPANITVTAGLKNLTGTPTLTIVQGTMSVTPALTGGQFTFTATQMTSDTVTLRLSLTSGGTTYTSDYTVAKVREGADGGPGNKTGTAYLYAWSTAQPANPNGSSTYTWSSASNASFTGPTWSTTVPANPGGPGVRLWVAAKGVVAPGSDTTTTVTWPSDGSGYSVYAQSVNGASGLTVTVRGDNLDANQAGYAARGVTFSSGYTHSSGGRGHTLVVWDLATNSLSSAPVTYDTYGVGTAGLVSAINAVPAGKLIALYTYDASTLDVNLANALAVFGGPNGSLLWAGDRYSHVFVGQRGLNPGQAYWAYGPYFSDPDNGLKAVTAAYTSTNIIANGAQGASGFQSASPTVFRWDTSTPAAPSGAPTYTWATNSFGAAPSGWQLTPGTAPSPGFTLYAATVTIVDSASKTATDFNWTSASVTARGYAGQNGGTGAQGASSRVMYSRISGNPTPAGNTATVAGDNRPNSSQSNTAWGLPVDWYATDPNPSSTSTLYQSDGIYNPASGNTVWSTPYISSLKVGSLSAITVNTGSLTADGNIRTTTGYLLGGNFTGWGWPASGGGFALGVNGLLLGNNNTGPYMQINADGTISSTFLSVNSSGSATFSGNLSAAGGTFAGSLSGASGTFTGTLSAGTVNGSTITGSTITGSTVTGGTIRTDAGSRRIELSAADNSLRAYYQDVVRARVGEFTSTYDYAAIYAVSTPDGPAASFVGSRPNSASVRIDNFGTNGLGLAISCASTCLSLDNQGTDGRGAMLVKGTLSVTDHVAGVRVGHANSRLTVGAPGGAVGSVLSTNNMTISASTPSAGTGNDGDIWIQT